MSIDPKELALVKREAGLAERLADSLTIGSAEELEAAAGVLSKVKQSQKDIKTRKELITRPLNEAKDAVMALFAPFEAIVNKAEILIKSKMMSFRVEDKARIAREQAEVAKAQALLEAKVDKRTIAPAVAIRKAEALETQVAELATQAPTTVRSAGGAKLQFRKVRVVYVVDEAKVPRAYLVLDMVRIRRDALDGKVIPGVEVREEEQPAAS